MLTISPQYPCLFDDFAYLKIIYQIPQEELIGIISLESVHVGNSYLCSLYMKVPFPEYKSLELYFLKYLKMSFHFLLA